MKKNINNNFNTKASADTASTGIEAGVASKIASLASTSLAAMFAVAMAFGLVGVSKADAATTTTTTPGQSTYYVDVAGNGCGNNCADFYNYLAARGISVGTNNSNTSNSSYNGVPTGSSNGTNSMNSAPVGQNGKAPSTSYVQYPYQVYTPFASAATNSNGANGSGSAYGTTGANSYGANGYSTNGTSGSGTQMGTINYVQYPYYAYNYFQDPSSKPDSYLSGTYSDPAYVYYGKDAATQMSKYKKASTPASSNANGSSGSGFTITSIIK
jgi:hypothetical protein